MNTMWITHPEKTDIPLLFRKEFPVSGPLRKSTIRITAGTYYRLKINGVWLCDGPGRPLPGTAFFDTLEAESLLHPGRNLIEVTAIGPLWAELQLEYSDGSAETIVSDAAWMTAEIPLHFNGSTEIFDNRNALHFEFQNAAVSDGSGKMLRERDCRMLTRKEFLLSGFAGNFRIDPVGNALLPGRKEDISDAEALIYPDFDNTVIHPSDGYGMMLKYDLPATGIGYWSFVVSAAAGTVLELSSGGAQKVIFTCREGVNRYTTFTRFRGEKLEMTLRDMQGDVRIQSVRMAESTYPAVKGVFRCSDYKLTRAWEAAERTLKLAMEDTFCDASPWGRDCRNEIRFALSGCGAYDLVRRTLRLGAESSPTVTWILALEDYYDHTGDRAFVREMWPFLRTIADTQLANLSPEGLAGSNTADSFYLAGALRAAERLNGIAGDMEVSYGQERKKLLSALSAVWDARYLAWPDTPFEGSSYSVAANALAVLADAVPEEYLPMTRTNILSPRPELRCPETPEEKMNYFLALEKLGAADRILPELLEEFAPQLDSGRTSFGSGENAGEAMLLYFVSRLALGFHLQPDGTFLLSPQTSALTWAQGSCMTPSGTITAEWHLTEDKKLQCSCRAPEGVTVHLPEK